MSTFVEALVTLLALSVAPPLASARVCPAGTTFVTVQDEPEVLDDDANGTWVCEGGCRAEWCERRNDDHHAARLGTVEYWDTGPPNASGDYRDGDRVGWWVGWYRNGMPRFHGAWRRRERTGHWTFWYASGGERMEGHFAHDVRTGQWSFWDERGVLQRRGLYDLGIPTGHWIARDPNGSGLVSVVPSVDTGFEEKATGGPCTPRRVDGTTRIPALPTLRVLGISDAGIERTAHVVIENPHDDVACFSGYGPNAPLYRVEHWTGSEWREQRQRPFWCGNGVYAVPLAPHASSDFSVLLDDDLRPFRIVLFAHRRGDYGPYIPAVSALVDSRSR